jgi:putative endonuclease
VTLHRVDLQYRRAKAVAPELLCEGVLSVKYIYILQSEQDAEHFYTGITDDLGARLSKHNSGEVAHTARFRPWNIKSYVVFTGDTRALAFEKHLKSGSGRAFAEKRL